MPQNYLKAEELSITPIAGLIGAYGPINSGFLHPIVHMILTNRTDGELFISYDGITDHGYLPANGELILIPPLCRRPSNEDCVILKGQIVYGMALGSIGFVYLAGYYA